MKKLFLLGLIAAAPYGQSQLLPPSGCCSPLDGSRVAWDETWGGSQNLSGTAWNCFSSGYTGGNARWLGSTNGTNATCNWVYTDANHGSALAEITPSATTTWDLIIGPLLAPGATTGWTLLNIVKTDSSATGVTELNGIGFTNSTTSGCQTTSTAENCIAIIYEPGTSVDWLLVACNSSACSSTDTGVAYANSTWFEFVLSSAASGTIKAQVLSPSTLGAVVSTSTDVPTGVMNVIAIASVTSASRTFLLNKTTYVQAGVVRP
jgi:hypothetical protein